MSFRKFTHVERLGSKNIDTEKYLDGHVFVFTKIDGTNGCVWGEPDGSVHCGSRTRELTLDNDNAGFMSYIMNDDSMAGLREFCVSNPTLIVYGEWLGHNKFVGRIKRYVTSGFHIFAIYDRSLNQYIPYPQVVKLLDNVDVPVIPPIREYDNPSMDTLTGILDDARYNLFDNDKEGGEGIVVYNYDYRDEYGHVALGKIVRKEYIDSKKKKNKKVNIINTEEEFINEFVTTAFLDKCQNKIEQALGLDEWETTNKTMGMFINLVANDLIKEELNGYLRKKKWNVQFDFSKYQRLVATECRKWLGLV